jgi:hypothetical protein
MTLDQPLAISLGDTERVLLVVMSRALCREAVAGAFNVLKSFQEVDHVRRHVVVAESELVARPCGPRATQRLRATRCGKRWLLVRAALKVLDLSSRRDEFIARAAQACDVDLG